jgi:hypothetical protein
MIVGSMVAVSLLLVGTTAASGASKPTVKYCDAFDEFAEVAWSHNFAFGYEDEFGLDSIPVGDRVNLMILIWSPRLEQTAKTLSNSGPSSLEKRWTAVSQGYGELVDVLEDVGFSSSDIALLRKIDPTDPDVTDVEKALVDNDDITEEELLDAADEVEASGSIPLITLDKRNVPDKEEKAIIQAGKQCGVLT